MVTVRLINPGADDSDLAAGDVRSILSDHGVMSFNVMGGPGSGKTRLLERTLSEMRGEFRFGVITGDLFTSLDAERIEAVGVPAVQINTEGGTHLTAHMIREVLSEFDLDSLDCLFIENIGNLICPAAFDLGEDYRIALLSATDGDDKIEKFQKLFRIAGATIISKTDLANETGFNMGAVEAHLQVLSPDALIFKISASTGEGMTDWTSWIRDLITEAKKMGV